MKSGANRIDSILQDAIIALNNYFVYESLKVLNGYRGNLTNKVDADFFDDLHYLLGQYIKHNNVSDPNIKVYHLINKTFQTNDLNTREKIYFDIKNLVMDSWDQLTSGTKLEAIFFAINLARKLKFACVIGFDQEEFQLNQFVLTQGVHLTYGKINSTLFYSIVKSTCDVKEFDLCDRFIETNKQYLQENEKHNILLISYAYYNFKQNKYNDALKNLLITDFLSKTFETSNRILELKCYYHIDDFDLFDACSKRFFRFLNIQATLNDQIKNKGKSFIVVTKKLFKAKSDNNPIAILQEVEKFLNEVDDMIFQKPWILEQLNDFKKKWGFLD